MKLMGRRGIAGIAALAAAAAGLGLLLSVGVAGATTYATINGQGSTYASLAFQQWTQAEQVQGLNINYTATGSPAGLQAFEQNTADFAGTEAEYSELYTDTPNGTANTHVPRGFAYTPDVAGAVAIMYNVALHPTGGTPINYLQLSRQTVAKIFLGDITNWDSPTITADNKGLVLPNKPITIDYRTGQSGTTALFYDFVQHTEPTLYATWAKNNDFPTTSRVWEIDDGAHFPPSNSEGFPGSTQQASSVASKTGMWSIGYDEFGFAKVYGDNVAWIENASGSWVKPFALNIAAALQTAQLAKDTSQTLLKVYGSLNPLAYPISAYSYILYQCAPTPTRPTCKMPYSNPDVLNTMAKFMRYIACTGQAKMATIGYSPLPTQLSQFMANAIGYLNNQPPQQLGATNCGNPQFKTIPLPKPPSAPLNKVTTIGPGQHSGTTSTPTQPKPTSSGAGTHGKGSTGSSSHHKTTSVVTTTSTPTGLRQSPTSTVKDRSTNVLTSAPVAYVGPPSGTLPLWPLIALVGALVVPAVLLGQRRRGRRSSTAGATFTPPDDFPGSSPRR